MLDRPHRHGSFETGELVLAQDDLDQCRTRFRIRTRLDEESRDLLMGRGVPNEERRDQVEGFSKPLSRQFEGG